MGRQHSSKRKPPSDRLCDGHHVGLHVVVLIREPLAGTPQSALDLIDQQQRPASGGERARCFQELAAHKLNSAFALNGLNRHRADAVVELLLEIFNVVELHEFNSGKQRREDFAILCLSRGRERPIGAAMEGIFHCQDAPFRLRFSGSRLLRIGASDL